MQQHSYCGHIEVRKKNLVYQRESQVAQLILSLNLHECTNHSSRPSRSNSMDLGVVGTATTSILQAALIQDDKSLIWPGHVQVLITVHAHKIL